MNEKWVADEIMALKKGDSKAHASTHGNSGSDRVTLDSSQITSGTLNTARMPIATTTAVGSVKVGSGLSVTSDGTLSANGSSTAWGDITGTLSNQTDLNTALSGKAASSHSHAASDITSGQLAIARIPTGTSSSTVCVGNDYRLSNARSPTSHSHSYSDLPTASTSSRGCVQVGSGLSISNGVLSVSSSGSSVVARPSYEGSDVVYYIALNNRKLVTDVTTQSITLASGRSTSGTYTLTFGCNYYDGKGPYQLYLHASAGYYPESNYFYVGVTNVVLTDVTTGSTIWTVSSASNRTDTPLAVGSSFYATAGHAYSISYNYSCYNTYTSSAGGSIQLEGDFSEVPYYLCVLR